MKSSGPEIVVKQIINALFLCILFIFGCESQIDRPKLSNAGQDDSHQYKMQHAFKLSKRSFDCEGCHTLEIAVSANKVIAVNSIKGYIDFFSNKGEHLQRAILPENNFYFKQIDFDAQNDLKLLTGNEESIFTIQVKNGEIRKIPNENEEAWYKELGGIAARFMECNSNTFFNKHNRSTCIDCEKFDYYYSFFADASEDSIYQVLDYCLIKWDLRQCYFSETNILPFAPARFRDQSILAHPSDNEWFYSRNGHVLHQFNPIKAQDSIIWANHSEFLTSNLAASKDQRTIWVAYEVGDSIQFDSLGL